MVIVLECSSRGVARFACAQAGCVVCLEFLLQEHQGLIRWMIEWQGGGGKAEYADLIQEGRIGLWRAILHFDAGRGVAFSSYACVVIQHQLWEAVTRSQKVAGWLEEVPLADTLDMLIGVWQQVQIHQALEEELERLPPRLRKLIELHYGWLGSMPLNLSEIGRIWGVSRERIRQLHEQALFRLRIPALSLHLFSLYERQDRRSYRQALRKNQAWQRKLRGR